MQDRSDRHMLASCLHRTVVSLRGACSAALWDCPWHNPAHGIIGEGILCLVPCTTSYACKRMLLRAADLVRHDRRADVSSSCTPRRTSYVGERLLLRAVGVGLSYKYITVRCSYRPTKRGYLFVSYFCNSFQ